MKYRLIIDLETKIPYENWDAATYTYKDLAVNLIKILGIKQAIVHNMALHEVENYE